MKPLTLYWRNYVPNPSKVLVVPEELGLPYQSCWVELEDLKKEPLTKVNPNGRVPAMSPIVDPNTGVTLFESGAIVAYLIETYYKEGKLTYSSSPEKWQLQQWFNIFHSEKIDSAQARYAAEIKCVVGVLDAHLEGKSWLVGDKCAYADLAFVMWNAQIAFIMSKSSQDQQWDEDKFSNFKKWHGALLARERVKKVMSVLADQEVKSDGKV